MAIAKCNALTEILSIFKLGNDEVRSCGDE